MANNKSHYLFLLLIIFVNFISGRIAATASKSMDVVRKCGEEKTKRKIEFVSPSYPKFHKGDLFCPLVLHLRNDTTGIKLEFIDVIMDGYLALGEKPGCNSDLFFIRGFGTWAPPPMCGNLTGYSTIIERTRDSQRMEQLELYWVMSSAEYRWKIKVTQFVHLVNNKKLKSATSTRVQIPRIVNGDDTWINQVPWHVSIRDKEPTDFDSAENATVSTKDEDLNANKLAESENNGTKIPGSNCNLAHFCLGSIIGHRHILTAAHCPLYNLVDLDTIKVVAGTWDLRHPENGSTPENKKEQEYEIETVFFHYAYETWGLLNDVAVIKLKTSIVFNENVQPIRMASPGDRFEGKQAMESGFRHLNLTATDDEKTPPLHQSSRRFQVLKDTECQNSILRSLFGADLELEDIVTHPKYTHVFDSLICTKSFSNDPRKPDETLKNENVCKRDGLLNKGETGGSVIAESHPVSGGVILFGIVFTNSIDVSGTAEPGNVQKDVSQSVALFRDWIDMALTQ